MVLVPPTELDRSPSVAVVEQIAAAEGVDPVDLDVSLYDVLDPDALDALFRPATDGDAATTRVTFPVADYQVTVTGDREVVVRER